MPTAPDTKSAWFNAPLFDFFAQLSAGGESSMAVAKITALEAYALHGSTSYGPISSLRLKSILLGAQPNQDERPRVRQALMEMPGSHAFDLALELGISYQTLDERCRTLFGQVLPR